MDNIVAVLDCQGFNLSAGFIPREIAVVSDQISQCMELNTEINWKDLSEPDKKTVLFSTQEIHGLHFNPFNPRDCCYLYTSKEIGEVIKIWYDMITFGDSSKLFAYKNQQLGEILKTLEIPSYNLDDSPLIPSYDKIKEGYGDNYLCSYHKKPPRNKRFSLNCAYRKSNHLYRFLTSLQLKNKENMNWS